MFNPYINIDSMRAMIFLLRLTKKNTIDLTLYILADPEGSQKSQLAIGFLQTRF